MHGDQQDSNQTIVCASVASVQLKRIKINAFTELTLVNLRMSQWNVFITFVCCMKLRGRRDAL